MTRAVLTLAALPMIGCAGLSPWSIPLTPARHSDTEAILAESDDAVAAGHERQALALYEKVAKEHAGQYVAA